MTVKRFNSSGTWEDVSGGVAQTEWGNITGTLSNQTDLKNALDLKLSLSGGTMTGAINMSSKNLNGVGTIGFNGTSNVLTNSGNELAMGGVEFPRLVEVANAPSGNYSGRIYIARYGKMRVINFAVAKFTSNSILTLESKDYPNSIYAEGAFHGVLLSPSNSALIQIGTGTSSGRGAMAMYYGTLSSVAYFGSLCYMTD